MFTRHGWLATIKCLSSRISRNNMFIHDTYYIDVCMQSGSDWAHEIVPTSNLECDKFSHNKHMFQCDRLAKFFLFFHSFARSAKALFCIIINDLFLSSTHFHSLIYAFDTYACVVHSHSQSDYYIFVFFMIWFHCKCWYMQSSWVSSHVLFSLQIYDLWLS